METLIATEPKWKEAWKERLDTLKEKLERGKVDLKDELIELESDLKSYIDRVKKLLNKHVKQHEKARLIKARLEEMQVQLALAKADTEDLIHDETKKLRDKLHAIKWDTLDWLKTVKEEKTEELKEIIEDELEFYTARLEMINVQVHLGRAEAREKWEELKGVLINRLYLLRNRVEHEAEDKWGDLKKDMALRLRKWADRLE